MATVNYYGPYDVTQYATWQAAVTAGVAAGSALCSVVYGNTVIFVEVQKA